MPQIHFTENLQNSLTEPQRSVITDSLNAQLTKDGTLPNDTLTLGAFFDAQGLPCPMPLLKAKVALRTLTAQESLYLLASDGNSQTDIAAFCQKNALAMRTWTTTHAQTSATIFHFIITKNV
ncbi:hypothetical protein B0181_01270 [Moraxella caviae]|uniref:Sulfur transfer protein SirA n=1 Tax=Moraxella caviae TaxID=34060 RepID=A0A1T0AAR5_9GAMM|nr:sulfurtransferase TusA family protein [Moraxella caviae]OOR92793.1 hypothetical protein B0181_01270 [Moraxella caviae]STZ14170.1 sulfur transfer protein SirA [Moraxella caviae]VEW12616.1 sulfur transfer protein SirA [Moraxella caviae]